MEKQEFTLGDEIAATTTELQQLLTMLTVGHAAGVGPMTMHVLAKSLVVHANLLDDLWCRCPGPRTRVLVRPENRDVAAEQGTSDV